MLYNKRHLYIITETLGADLFNAIIRPKRKLTPKELQTIVRDILQCLIFLKKYGIIHCDLKPENILMKNESMCNIKVIDFGSASFIDNQEYDYLQTRPYRAPEVSFGSKFDFAADMWSLGCIIYELLTGTVLFRYKTVQENFAKALCINNCLDFKMFSEGKKFKTYTSQNGLITIADGARNGEKGLSKVVIPKDGCNFKGELESFTKNPELTHFIRRCLILDPAKRQTVEEALDSPYIKSKIM